MDAIKSKLYTEMTPDEQLRYVTDLTQFCTDKLPVLERLGDAWEAAQRKDMETGLALMNAFQFAREFVDKAVRYGDYAARVYRLRVYFDKIKTEISRGLAIKGADGHTYALVAPTVPARRRGRPTAAEAEARRQGFTVDTPDPEMEKQIKIAQLMGFEIKVSQERPREKNNAEIAAEKAARQAEHDRHNPSLFAAEAQPAADAQAAAQPAPEAPMAAIYQDRISTDRLHLSDLAWLCSPELQERIAQVRSQRTTFGAAAERAKLLGEQGADAKTIEPYARQAEEARQQFEATYQAVDEELAIQFRRLQIDDPYIQQFQKRFKGVDIEKILHITRPYYEKLRRESPEIDVRVQAVIQQADPAYAAKLQADADKKREIAEILRYLKRKDKPNVAQRIQTMQQRYQRLVELLGESEAKVYYPIVAAAIKDYEQNYKKEEPAEAEQPKAAPATSEAKSPEPTEAEKKPKATKASEAKPKKQPAARSCDKKKPVSRATKK